MSLILRQSTAKVVSFGPFLDKTDGVTPEVGLVSAIDHATTGILLSKNGGALTIRSQAVTASTYDAYGNYIVTLSTTDTNTIGTLRMQFIETATCLPVWQDFIIVEEATYDALFAASAPGYLQPATAGRTLVVDAAGLADANAVKVGPTGAGTAQTAGDLKASIAALNNLSAAAVNAEVVDALNVDTYAEIGQEAPASTQTLRKMVAYLYKAWRNRSTQTATAYSLYNDDAATVDQKSTVSDDATTFDSGEKVSGP